MRGQVSFEALINIGFLMLVMASIVWSIDSRISVLSSNSRLDSIQVACESLNMLSLNVMKAPNSSLEVFFSEPFNLSFNDSRSLTISKGGSDYLCLTLTSDFFNSSMSKSFSLMDATNISLSNVGGLLVVS